MNCMARAGNCEVTPGSGAPKPTPGSWAVAVGSAVADEVGVIQDVEGFGAEIERRLDRDRAGRRGETNGSTEYWPLPRPALRPMTAPLMTGRSVVPPVSPLLVVPVTML